MSDQFEEIQKYRKALADAIRRPMGVIPDSAEGLVTDEEIEEAEKRRSDKGYVKRRGFPWHDYSVSNDCGGGGWAE